MTFDDINKKKRQTDIETIKQSSIKFVCVINTLRKNNSPIFFL